MEKPFDPSKPVATRDGHPARIITTSRVDDQNGRTIVALVRRQREREDILVVDATGRVMTYGNQGSDLVNVPRKVVRHMAIYKDGSAGSLYENLSTCQEMCPSASWYAHVEWEE